MCRFSIVIQNAALCCLMGWLTGSGVSEADPTTFSSFEVRQNQNWQKFCDETTSELKSQQAKLRELTKYDLVEQVRPMLLVVVLIPGDPISEFGSGIVEFLLIEIEGKRE